MLGGGLLSSIHLLHERHSDSFNICLGSEVFNASQRSAVRCIFTDRSLAVCQAETAQTTLRDLRTNDLFGIEQIGSFIPP